jgi:hypothetical protein
MAQKETAAPASTGSGDESLSKLGNHNANRNTGNQQDDRRRFIRRAL